MIGVEKVDTTDPVIRAGRLDDESENSALNPL
jgi:hypothetical protein